MRRNDYLIILALAAATSADSANAQQVRATVVDEVTQQPLHGAIVVLLGPDAQEHDASLANAAGESILTARAAGVYTVRVQRIGYASTHSEAFHLQPGGSIFELRLAAPRVAISLAAVNVQGEQRCSVRPGEGSATLRLLEEARKTLRATALTASQLPPELVVRRYERDLEMPSERVQREQSQKHTLRGGRAFVSRPTADLARGGYARVEGGKLRLFAPDVEVLLSDEFLSSHCFKLQAAPRGQLGLLGLGFEPVGGAKTPDIAGVLWLDRASAELRHAEFSYQRLPAAFADGDYRARLEFRGISGGGWIVDRWWIRMPLELTRQAHVRFADTDLSAREELRESAVREEGGEVLAVSGVGSETEGLARQAALAGSLFDSTRSSPLAGATVALTGTAYSATTSPDGRFQLRDLPPGRYTLVLDHPRFDSLGFEPDSHIVDLRTAEKSELRLAIPGEARVRAIACPDSATRAEGRGALFGTVWRYREGEPAADATVSVSWTEWDGNTLALIGQNREATVRTDGRGFYRVCGIPPDYPLRLHAAAGADSSSATLTLPRNAHLRRDVVLTPPTGE